MIMRLMVIMFVVVLVVLVLQLLLPLLRLMMVIGRMMIQGDGWPAGYKREDGWFW